MSKKSANNDLVSLIFSTSRFIKESIRKSSLGSLTMTQLETLGYILRNPNHTMRDVAEYLSIAPPSATEIVDSLSKEKYVERVANSKDRREVKLRATKKGKLARDKAKKISEKRIREATAKLTALEKKQLIKILQKIVKDN